MQTLQTQHNSDAAKRGVLSGSSLFAYRGFNSKYNKRKTYSSETPKTTNKLIQMPRMDSPLIKKGLKVELFLNVSSSKDPNRKSQKLFSFANDCRNFGGIPIYLTENVPSLFTLLGSDIYYTSYQQERAEVLASSDLDLPSAT